MEIKFFVRIRGALTPPPRIDVPVMKIPLYAKRMSAYHSPGCAWFCRRKRSIVASLNPLKPIQMLIVSASFLHHSPLLTGPGRVVVRNARLHAHHLRRFLAPSFTMTLRHHIFRSVPKSSCDRRTCVLTMQLPLLIDQCKARFRLWPRRMVKWLR
jgi:hypothetical protein